MSHSTVLIIGDDWEKMLEPYDEDRRVAPYWEVEAESPQQFWATRSLVDEGLVPENPTFEQLIAALAKKYPDEGAYRVEDGVLKRQTTYNPDSRWDWYALGGRWRGALRLKPGASGELTGPHWTETFDGAEPAELDPLACDSALKCDLDIEGMRQAAADRAAQTWDKYAAIIAEHGDVIPWSTFADKHGVTSATTREERDAALEAARAEYRAQPALKPLEDAGLIGVFSGVEENFHHHNRDSYIHLARLGAVPGFATLTEDGWMERGRMGWFGAHSGDREDHWVYLEAANKAIDDAPDDALFTLVDVHI